MLKPCNCRCKGANWFVFEFQDIILNGMIGVLSDYILLNNFIGYAIKFLSKPKSLDLQVSSVVTRQDFTHISYWFVYSHEGNINVVFTRLFKFVYIVP